MLRTGCSRGLLPGVDRSHRSQLATLPVLGVKGSPPVRGEDRQHTPASPYKHLRLSCASGRVDRQRAWCGWTTSVLYTTCLLLNNAWQFFVSSFARRFVIARSSCSPHLVPRRSLPYPAISFCVLRFFAWYPAHSSPPAILADMLASMCVSYNT